MEFNVLLMAIGAVARGTKDFETETPIWWLDVDVQAFQGFSTSIVEPVLSGTQIDGYNTVLSKKKLAKSFTGQAVMSLGDASSNSTSTILSISKPLQTGRASSLSPLSTPKDAEKDKFLSPTIIIKLAPDTSYEGNCQSGQGKS